jgi:23S rRNA (adenine2503-C2)-methyltransferase
MGEPLANVEPVCAALDRLHDDLGLSARHLTVSTVGVVPGIRKLAEFHLPVTLAVSLHAPDDALRAELVPLNHRYPIAAVIDAAREYAATKGRRVTFEYACIAGVNDEPEQADRLAHRLAGLRGGAHVNLIPLNPTGDYGGAPPDRARINRFAARLAAAGVTVTVRRNRGVDIDAACGQLRARSEAADAHHQPGRDRAAGSARMVP